MAHSDVKMVSLLTRLNPGTMFLIFAIFFISHVEVASFVLADSFKRPHHRLSSSLRSSSDGLDSSKVEAAIPKPVFTENVMNQRLIELGSKPIDFELLKETIAEWSKPLPRAYLFQPIILVGPSGVGKGKLVKALMKDYKKFFCKIVTHTTRGYVSTFPRISPAALVQILNSDYAFMHI
jgi:Guanylate kinase